MAKNKKNSALLYKIISGMTLVLPMSITLIISAIWSSPTPNVVVMFDTPNEIKKVEDLGTFITFEKFDDKKIKTKIDFDKIDEINAYNVDFTAYEKEEDGQYLFKNDYYVRFVGEKFDKIIEFTIENEVVTFGKVSNINKETGNKLSIGFISSVIATVIVVAIISNKMRLYRKYPKLATFIALLIGTIILAIIETIIGGILNVFIVATISWGAYCLENYFYKNSKTNTEGEKKYSDLLNALERINDEYK